MKKLALLIAASLLLTGCVGQNLLSETQQPPTVAPTPALPTGGQTFDLNPTDFTPNITNPNLPLKAGTRWTYREVEGSEVTTVVTVATGDTKVLANGIEARVIRDSSWVAGKIVEDTFDWYAQDRAGNVWYLGEDTSVWEDGKITSRAGSFEAGKDGALAGVAMPAALQQGLRFRAEYYKDEAEEDSEVLGIGELAEVEAGRYRNVALIKGTTPLEKDVEELKFYAPNVGLVMALVVSGGDSRTELVKVDRVPLTYGTGPLGGGR